MLTEAELESLVSQAVHEAVEKAVQVAVAEERANTQQTLVERDGYRDLAASANEAAKQAQSAVSFWRPCAVGAAVVAVIAIGLNFIPR
jgi:anti-sigma-K factor RskA